VAVPTWLEVIAVAAVAAAILVAVWHLPKLRRRK
jgi:hypothetical protein